MSLQISCNPKCKSINLFVNEKRHECETLQQEKRHMVAEMKNKQFKLKISKVLHIFTFITLQTPLQKMKIKNSL